MTMRALTSPSMVLTRNSLSSKLTTSPDMICDVYRPVLTRIQEQWCLHWRLSWCRQSCLQHQWRIRRRHHPHWRFWKRLRWLLWYQLSTNTKIKHLEEKIYEFYIYTKISKAGILTFDEFELEKNTLRSNFTRFHLKREQSRDTAVCKTRSMSEEISINGKLVPTCSSPKTS